MQILRGQVKGAVLPSVTGALPSVNDLETAIASGQCCGKTPCRDTRFAFNHRFGFALRIENLPGNRATLLPAGAVGPDQQRFSLRVRNGDGVFLSAATRRRNGLADVALVQVNK